MLKKRNKKLKIRINLFIVTFVILCFSFIFSNFIEDNKDIEGNENNLEEYKETYSQNISSQYLKLVNKSNSIDANYEPNDLVIPSIRFGNIGNMMVQYMRRDAAVALEQLFKAAKKEGINLVAISGYRSYDYQETVYSNEVNSVGEIQANRYVAKPGQSEHQTGLVMDVLSDEYMSLDEGFENTAAFKWLDKNMSKFGFILRFPKGQERITGYGYEAWHLRYVGIEAATEIMDNGITLEEYLSELS